jgi:hypothetical protein
MSPSVKLATTQPQKGRVHCPICTHSVEAEILSKGKHMFTRPGQKCPRCAASLDPAYVLRFDRAA